MKDSMFWSNCFGFVMAMLVIVALGMIEAISLMWVLLGLAGVAVVVVVWYWKWAKHES